MEGVDQVLAGLQAAYLSANALTTPLNNPFREGLRIYAETCSFEFFQDTAGNIYISEPGQDPDLAPIAVSFSLDDGLSKATFESAIRIFSLLSREKSILCGLVLVGWTSLDLEPIGRKIWDASGAKSPSEVRPELEQFQTMRNPGDISVSAVLDVSEEEDETTLKIEGSPVLIDQARSAPSVAPAEIREVATKPIRAPVISIRGPEANSVACGLIRSYSAYVVELFDNFE